MYQAFENEKNMKAAAYTTVVCVLLFIVFFFAKWTLPQIPEAQFDEGIEVNLGNSDEGFGDIAPQMPGEPAPSQEQQYSPPPASASSPTQTSVEGDENEADDVPVVNKIEKVIPKKTNTQPAAQPNNRSAATAPSTARSTQNTAVSTPTPAPPKPKALFKGAGNGSGGNGADSYNGVRDQGIAGGRGDQGNPNGNINSDSYKGNASSGNSGVRIRSGLSGRRFTRLPSFEDEFNENAKVAVDIKVDKSGNVISAIVNPKGTTTTNSTIRSIATRKAMQLKLNAGAEDDQSGTILFDFKLRG